VNFTKRYLNRGAAAFLLTLAASALAACGSGSDNTSSTIPIMTMSNSGSCNKLSPKIGQIAVLSTKSHGVSGKARVVDDCTIEITNFTYDGGGLPDVFVYGGKARNYAVGFPIGPNLFGKAQANATIVLTLKDKELDNLDGISIWCVRAGVSFGDGVFAASVP
jgi:hypothetical protein